MPKLKTTPGYEDILGGRPPPQGLPALTGEERQPSFKMVDDVKDCRFVAQLHRASTLHFDFRLERDGVFKSWVIPKGLPEEVGVRRLAIQVEDHPLAFGEFQGEIHEGQYGAGTVEIWDHGTYRLEEWLDDRIVFTLFGERLQGTYSLVRFRHGGDREWLIFKKRSYAD